MVFDSVREELAMKISPLPKPGTGELNPIPNVSITSVTSKPFGKFADDSFSDNSNDILDLTVEEQIAEMPVKVKLETSDLPPKPTSPTLAEFHTKSASLPEWRLQLQNAVRLRTEQPSEKTKSAPVLSKAALKTDGATALQPRIEEVIETKVSANPALDRALKRIEESRQKFSSAETNITAQNPVTEFPVMESRNRPVTPIIGQRTGIVTKFPVKEVSPATETKPDTNKLPSLIEGSLKSFSGESVFADPGRKFEENNPHITDTTGFEGQDNSAELSISGETETEEFDDCAPLSLRFNAAVFDLLIGSFLSLLLLSPFILANGNFFSTQGILAFLATCSIVMFIYLTASIGFLGRTFGMKLFSLEIIDAEENAYPTIHQAAVSSSVYLVSLALGGLGFLPILMNKEKRAAHDLLSGTIIVKEY